MNVTGSGQRSFIAVQMAQKRRAAPSFASAAFTDVATAESWGNIQQQQPKAVEDEVLPAKGPARSPGELLEVKISIIEL